MIRMCVLEPFGKPTDNQETHASHAGHVRTFWFPRCSLRGYHQLPSDGPSDNTPCADTRRTTWKNRAPCTYVRRPSGLPSEVPDGERGTDLRQPHTRTNMRLFFVRVGHPALPSDLELMHLRLRGREPPSGHLRSSRRSGPTRNPRRASRRSGHLGACACLHIYTHIFLFWVPPPLFFTPFLSSCVIIMAI